MLTLQQLKESVKEQRQNETTRKIIALIDALEGGKSTSDFLPMVCSNHNGKMSQMISISSSPLINPNCLALSQNPSCVCSHCFSMRQLKRFTSQQLNLLYNSVLLSNVKLSKAQLKQLHFNALFVRFEAFGDLINDTQLLNYFAIARVNKGVKFALFTKRYNLILNYLRDGGIIPSNVNLILSSPFINKTISSDFLDVCKGYQPNANIKVFSVYDSKYIDKNDININCGARNCFECRKCYTKNNTIYINEKLK